MNELERDMFFWVEEAEDVEEGLATEECLMIMCGLVLMLVRRTSISVVTITQIVLNI